MESLRAENQRLHQKVDQMMENSEVERQEKERIWGLVNAGKAETKKLQEEKDQLKDSFT